MTPDLINWLASLAFILAVIAFVLEVFVFPGFGISGVIGIILVGWGVMLVAVDATQVTEAMVLAIIVTIIILIVGLRLMSRYNLWRRLSLQNKQLKNDGYIAPAPGLIFYNGKEGIAMTPLRPAGSVEVNGHRLDVITEGEFISPGARVRVIKVEGTRVVVKEIAES
ncbi:MAG: NfeD family protein [Desulfotomaculaceae bacterium]|nr:NfeD family protein [Desulfotomaculaceae bacterium]